MAPEVRVMLGLVDGSAPKPWAGPHSLSCLASTMLACLRDIDEMGVHFDASLVLRPLVALLQSTPRCPDADVWRTFLFRSRSLLGQWGNGVLLVDTALRTLVSEMSLVCYEYNAVVVAYLLLATHHTHSWETGPASPAPVFWSAACPAPASAPATVHAPVALAAVSRGASVVSPMSQDDISSLTGGSVPPPAAPVPTVMTSAPWTCSWTSSPAVAEPAGPSAEKGGWGRWAPSPPRHEGDPLRREPPRAPGARMGTASSRRTRCGTSEHRGRVAGQSSPRLKKFTGASV